MLLLCGSAVALFGALLLVRSGLLLLGRGRPRRGLRPAFVIAGPYRRVRNPLLGGGLLLAFGVAVATRRVAWVAVAGVAAACLHLWVVWREEPALSARFGTAYAEYLSRVPRWLPRRG